VNYQMIDKKNNLVWIDLEMTGLDVTIDTIVEIALVITDAQLNILQEGPSFAIHHPESVLEAMDPWCQVQHTKSGLVNAIKQSTVTLAQAEQQILHIIQMYCAPKISVLCGNTIWQDRIFLARYMPSIVEYTQQ
jgi:oligoribonuclease